MTVQEQIIRPDGRVELLPEVDAALEGSGLHNEDLAPVPIEKRTWTTYNYLALWIGMAINIPTWLLASGLVALGMAWYQAHPHDLPCQRHRPDPDACYQPRGHQVRHPVPDRCPGVVRHRTARTCRRSMRAVVACGWFGIQTWIGGAAIFAVVGALLRRTGDASGWTRRRRSRSASATRHPSRGRCGSASRSSGPSTS